MSRPTQRWIRPASLALAALFAAALLAPATQADDEEGLLGEAEERIMEVVYCATLGADKILEDLLGEGYPGQQAVHAVQDEFRPGGTVYDTLENLTETLEPILAELYRQLLVLLDQVIEDLNRTMVAVAEAFVVLYLWAFGVKCYVAQTLAGIQHCSQVNVEQENETLVVSGAVCGGAAWLAFLQERFAALQAHLAAFPWTECTVLGILGAPSPIETQCDG